MPEYRPAHQVEVDANWDVVERVPSEVNQMFTEANFPKKSVHQGAFKWVRSVYCHLLSWAHTEKVGSRISIGIAQNSQ